MKAVLQFMAAVVFLAGCQAHLDQEKAPEWPPMTRTEVAGSSCGNSAVRAFIASDRPGLETDRADKKQKTDSFRDKSPKSASP